MIKDIAIFGFGNMDGNVGILLNFLDKKFIKRLNCVISLTKQQKNIDIKKESRKRYSKKIEFVINNKFYNLPVFDSKNFIKILKDRKIKKTFIIAKVGKEKSIVFKKCKKENIKILSFIHSSVKLIGQNNIGEGTIIFPDCYIGYKSDIGDGCFIHSGCRIEHHNTIGNFCDINPNLTTGGFTKIGNYCEINMSVDIINKIKIGNFSRVGAGSLVLKNVGNKELHYGRPARFVREN